MDDVLNALHRVVDGATFDLSGNQVSSMRVRTLYRDKDINGIIENTNSL